MDTQPTRFEALCACRDLAGSDSQMARDLKIAQPTVWRWLNVTKQMPTDYVLAAERLYGISKHDLRPDIYPRENMVDQVVEDRFCGIDLRARDRRTAPRRVA